MNKIRAIELFAGYGSQQLALKRLKHDYPDFDYEVVAYCEIDKHAITAYKALHGDHITNLGDVSKVDWAEWHRRHPQPVDLLTYSSPCQDFSSAGLQRGGEEGSGTRSGLLWETERAVSELRPRHLVFENVGGLVSGKFIDLFQRWQVRLNGYGYTNFAQLMNAKDYGVPQNRLRIFMVSILDCPRAYYFPQPFRLERRLKDVLEQNVAERYYLSDERVAKLMQETAIHSDRGNGFAFRPHTPEEIASTVECSGIGDKTDNFVVEPCIYNRPHGYFGGDINKEYSPAIAATEAMVHKWVIEPTIYGLPHGYYEGDLYTDCAPAVKSSAYAANNPLIIPQATKEGYAVVPEGGVFDASYPDSKTRRGRVQEGGTVSPTIMASQNELLRYEGIRIRRLTERELYRLMDVDEKDIDTLLAAPIPRTQHAKLAGNSIVVACLYYIFRNLFVDTEPAAGTQTKLF